MDELAHETAKALLDAIKEAAPKANYGSLEGLARAYAYVVSAKPSTDPPDIAFSM